ncbi:hypothetical protein PsorP6_005184 [Peronosclerospora sorghi]|uniref:Uncharacterized protein n=1 Tax=Peronosclerospora sorghi TaxID=230839 RepID=A0ACC0W2S3_9STRA|nr:hypothetical protein PsorP6_005184 [Peronosclerospora sorghi]
MSRLSGHNTRRLRSQHHQMANIRSIQKGSTFDCLLGVAFIVIVALIWTFSSVLVQYILNCRLVTVKSFASALSSHRSGLSPTHIQREFKSHLCVQQHYRELDVNSFHCGGVERTICLDEAAGVILCMAGNISTIFNDQGPGSVGTDHVVRDLVALFVAYMYGVYTTAIRCLIHDDESVSISLFFGVIGVIIMVCPFPLVLIFHYSSIESLGDFSLDILLLIGTIFEHRAVLLTSPTVATVGLSLTVPLAIVADFWFHGVLPTNITLLALALVIYGFVLINVGTRQNRHEYHHQRSTERSDKVFDSLPRSNSAVPLGI